MWKLTERRLTDTLILVCLLGLATLPAAARGDADSARLVEELEERFEVLALSEGYVLRPRAEDGFDLVEIRPQKVFVDGEAVSPEGLAAHLSGDDAERVLRLAGLGPVVEVPEEGGEEAPAAEADDRERALEERRRRREERREERASRRDFGRHRTDTRVSLGGDVTIPAAEQSREVVVVGGDLDVRGEVDGVAVAIGGSVEVSGEVDGDVTAVGGSVYLGPEAWVGGQVVSIGGVIDREPGARIEGGVVELSFVPLDFDDISWPRIGWPSFPRSDWADVFGAVFRTVFLIGFLVLTLVLARGSVDRTAGRVADQPWRSGLVGLIVEGLLLLIGLPLAIILCLSVIGIPLVVMGAVALTIVLLLGFGSVALALGRSLWRRVERREVHLLVALVVGVVLIQACALIAKGLGLGGGFLAFTALFLGLLGFLIKYVCWTVGLGAVVLSRFGGRPSPAVAIVPPPG